jgi:hypothetical protein
MNKLIIMIGQEKDGCMVFLFSLMLSTMGNAFVLHTDSAEHPEGLSCIGVAVEDCRAVGSVAAAGPWVDSCQAVAAAAADPWVDSCLVAAADPFEEVAVDQVVIVADPFVAT